MAQTEEIIGMGLKKKKDGTFCFTSFFWGMAVGTVLMMFATLLADLLRGIGV